MAVFLTIGGERTGPQGPKGDTGESGGDNITAAAPLVRTGDEISIPAATATSAGHATAAQITKLDGIAAGATVGPTLSSATPAAIAATGSAGAGTGAARDTHTHAHGNQAAGASLHAVATSSVSGFQSSADKALDTAEHTQRAVTASTTLLATDGFVDVSTAAGAVNVTAAGGTGVRCWVISKTTTDTNTITLARAGSETINGAASNLVLPDSDSDALPSWTVRRDATGNLRVL